MDELTAMLVILKIIYSQQVQYKMLVYRCGYLLKVSAEENNPRVTTYVIMKQYRIWSLRSVRLYIDTHVHVFVGVIELTWIFSVARETVPLPVYNLLLAGGFLACTAVLVSSALSSSCSAHPAGCVTIKHIHGNQATDTDIPTRQWDKNLCMSGSSPSDLSFLLWFGVGILLISFLENLEVVLKLLLVQLVSGSHLLKLLL